MHAAGHMRMPRPLRAARVTRYMMLLLAGVLCIPAAPAESSPQRRNTSRRSRGQTQPTADRIKEIQKALTKAGYYSAEVNGKWDSKTIEAMKRLQQANDMKPTGKINARSLQILGLGSEVAGLSPPREAVTTASAPD